MSEKIKAQPVTDNTVSAGAGIAIAGVWLATTSLTIIMLMIQFVWGAEIDIDLSRYTSEVVVWGFLLGMLILALPSIVAYYVTKLILSKD